MNLSIFELKVILPFFTALLSVFFIGYCLLKGRKTKLLYSYILLQIIVALWSIGRLWETLALDPQSKGLANIVLSSGMSFVGFGWLLFCGLYTKDPRFPKKKNTYLLLIPPSLFYTLFLTNNYHHLFLTSNAFDSTNFGVFCWLHIAVTYLYVIYGIMIMVKFATQPSKEARAQSILLIFSALIPFLFDVLDELSVIIYKNFLSPFDITLSSMSLSVLLFGVISFKYRFLNIIPVAWQKIMNHMNESMMIIDRFDNIVNFNRSFTGNFTEFVQTGSDNLIAFATHLSSRCDDDDKSDLIITAIKDRTNDVFSGELTLVIPEWKCFSVYIQAILSKRGEVQGRIVLFNDITNDKKLLQELNNKNTAMAVINQELATANETLKDYARTVEELAVAEERNRIARDIHDSVGHNITLLIALLEVTTDLYDQNHPETRTKIIDATGVARANLQELRRSIRNQTRIGDLLESLHKLIANFEASGIRIDFSVEGINDHLQPQYSEVIYRICQEALTNAIRHGKATQVTILLRFSVQTINLHIVDNGQGCKTITKGMGLTGMEQRVQELKGTIEYSSSGEMGFNINVEIPIN